MKKIFNSDYSVTFVCETIKGFRTETKILSDLGLEWVSGSFYDRKYEKVKNLGPYSSSEKVNLKLEEI